MRFPSKNYKTPLIVWTKKPTQRLLAAIAYKNGVSQTELAKWYDVQRRTIYSWLKRLDTDEPLEQAVSNDKEIEENKSCQNHS
jgi:transposase